MATISISQLDTATQASVDDLYEVAVVDANSQTGYASRKLTAAQIATLIAQGVQFSGLSTEAKTIIAAINEAAQNGGTEVEANPSGAATDTLKKIGIAGTIYGVGGSEPVSKTATGNLINITDAADAPIVSGTVAFEPKQDLHGYNKPWAGGVGKNKFGGNFEIGAIYASDNNHHTYEDQKASIDTRFRVVTLFNVNAEQVTISCDFSTYEIVLHPYSEDGYTVFPEDNPFNVWLSEPTTITGIYKLAIALRRKDEAVITSADFDKCKLQVELGSTATEYEPYSNICPIEGYTDCVVEVTGKNLLPNEITSYAEQGVTFTTIDSGKIKINGTSTGSIYQHDICENFSLPEGSYIFSYDPVTSVGVQICNRTEDIDYLTISDSAPSQTLQVTSAMSNDMRVRFVMNGGATVRNAVTWVMLRLATDTDATYEPYQSTIYTIDLDGTRYGGTVDLVSGEMVVDKAITTYNSNEFTLYSGSISGVQYVNAPKRTNARSYNAYVSEALVCDRAINGNGTPLANGVGIIRSEADTRDYFVGLPAGTTLENAKNLLAGMKVCYELATPFTVQLTPEQIRTLEGTNNISTNMTGMSLEYITQDYQPLVDLAEDNSGSSNDIVHLTQAEYDALPSTKESDDKLYLITDTNGDGSHFQPVIYSFEEREIGVWTDGKPLYEKSVNFGTLPNATTKDLNHNISDIDTVFISGGYAKNTTSGFVQQLNVPVPSNNQTDIQSQWYFGVTDSYIRCFTLTDRSAYDDCIVTLQYTKTTDNPGSGTWTPQGVPAVHYSTDEHVIGTWIDGKPLYEKSWNVSIALPSESANTWVSTGIEIASINCDGIAGGELIDDQNQCIAGSIGFIQQKTYFAIYSQIGGRTITKVTIRYTKSTD